MPNLSIKNVPAAVIEGLRERAARNHRSMQGELLALVSAAVAGTSAEPALAAPSGQGHKSIEQIAAEHLQRRPRPLTRGERSVDLIRADRDAR